MPARAAVTYTHAQDTYSDTWTINHGLNCFPIVDVYIVVDDALTKVIPKEIHAVDRNTLQILFSETQKGIARLV